MGKLTQKELDKMVLEALGEGEGKGGDKKPDVVKKLQADAAKRRAEVTTA